MNRNIINARKDNLTPQHALIIYQTSNGYSPDYYLEKHPITRTGGKYVIGAGEPCPDDMLRKLAMAFAKKQGTQMHHATLIGQHLILAQKNTSGISIIWYRPATQYPLNFAPKLKIKQAPNQKCPMPATLFLLRNTSLYCFALASNDRPTPKTKLYNAPFFNMYQDGAVCLGTANVGKYPAATFEGEAERYERGFFLAEQNLLHSFASKKPLNQLWTDLLTKKATAYPVKQLIQHSKHKTLQHLITNLVDKNFDEYDHPDFNEDDATEGFPEEVLNDDYLETEEN